MKQGRFTTLDSFFKEIERQAQSKLDLPIKAEDFSLIDANTTNLVEVNRNRHQLSMSALGHEQLASRLDIPKKYYDRMLVDYPELLVHNVNYLAPKVSEGYFVRALDNKVRGILSPRFKALDNFPAIASIYPPLRDAGFELASAEISDTLMSFKVISPRLLAEVKKGDVVQAGFWFRNSEVGRSRLTGGLFFNRLVCMNGMIMGKEYGFARNHSGKAIDFDASLEAYYTTNTVNLDNMAYFAKMTDVVKGMVCSQEGFRAAIQKFSNAAVEETKNPTKALEMLAEQLTLSKQETEGVLTKLIKGGDTTRWGIANALTAYSQEVADYDRATEFEAFGGKIIELPSNQWQTIAQAA